MTSEQPIHRLAVYGSLAPGRSNHHHLADVPGTWRRGWVRGTLIEAGWGAAVGYPGIRLDAGGEPVDVCVLESTQLAEHWDRLDDFEGAEYRRVEVDIRGLATEAVTGFIYELRTPDI